MTALALPNAGLEAWRRTPTKALLAGLALAHSRHLPAEPAAHCGLLPAVQKSRAAAVDALCSHNHGQASAMAWRAPAGAEAHWALHAQVANDEQAQLAHQITAESQSRIALDWHPIVADSALLGHWIELDVADGAQVTLRLHPQHGGGAAVLRLHANLGAGARLTVLSADGGAVLSRRELHVTLSGAGAAVDYRSLLAPQSRTTADASLWVSHRAPNTESKLAMRVLAADGARAIAHPSIHVGEAALGTDTQTRIASLLATSKSEVHAKPVLRIDTNEVKAGHGASFGQLDAAQAFYLQSRGIDATTARQLLLKSFVAPIWADLDAYSLGTLAASEDALMAAFSA